MNIFSRIPRERFSKAVTDMDREVENLGQGPMLWPEQKPVAVISTSSGNLLGQVQRSLKHVWGQEPPPKLV